MSRGGTKRLAQHAPFPREMVRPSRESRSNPVETAPWKQQGSQSFDRSPPMNADLFGAFSEDEQAKFLSNSTSYAQSTEYTDYSSEYDGFYPKRFRADHHTDDYSRHYPPPPPSSAWQYQAEPYYNTPASSQYSNPICK